MKKIISVMTALFILLISFAGCSEKPAAVDDKTLALNKTSVTLATFGEADIIATYNNIDQITWTNNNSQVISMTEHGNYVKVTALKAGISSVTVTGGGKTATCAVIVSESSDLLAVEIDRMGDVELNLNGSLYVPARATYRGETLEDASVIYSVKDTTIATVTKDGVVTGIKSGETVLTVQAENKGVKSPVKEIKVTVKDGPALVLSATHLNLYEKDSSASESYYPNSKNFDFYIVDGENKVIVTDYDLTSTDQTVATYSNGKIKALSEGGTTFTVTCEYQGKEYVAYLYVTVNKVPTVDVALSEEQVLLYTNVNISDFPTSCILAATVIIDGKQTSLQATWKVEEGINAATVSDKGVVTALGVGKAIISASYTYNGIESKSICTVEVVGRVRYGALIADVDKDKVDDINTNLIYAYLTAESNVIRINNVDLTTTNDLDLIRFGVPNYGTVSTIYRLFFRVTDVNDANNWIEFIYSSYNNGAVGGIMSYAMNASTWDIGDMVGLGARQFSGVDTVCPMAAASSRSESNYNRPSGAYYDNSTLRFSLENKQPDYTRDMVGFSVVDDQISLNFKRSTASATAAKWSRANVSVFSKALQGTLLAKDTTYENPVWSGFTDKGVTKVNITITVQINNEHEINPLIIDTIGGNSVSVSDLSRISIVGA